MLDLLYMPFFVFIFGAIGKIRTNHSKLFVFKLAAIKMNKWNIDPYIVFRFCIIEMNKWILEETSICVVKLKLKQQKSASSSEFFFHYSDVIIRPIASQITRIMIVYVAVYSGTDQTIIEWLHQSEKSMWKDIITDEAANYLN